MLTQHMFSDLAPQIVRNRLTESRGTLCEVSFDFIQVEFSLMAGSRLENSYQNYSKMG